MNDTNERSCASRGSQPEAWAVEWKGDTRIDRSTVCYTEDAAKRRANECPSLEGVCIPLYRSPTLTDEEREAIREAIVKLQTYTDMGATIVDKNNEMGCRKVAALMGLLERTK